MSVLCGIQRSDPITADAWWIALSSETARTGGFAIAFRAASRITHVPSGAQYSDETLRTTMTRAHLRMDRRYSETASRAE